MGRRSAEERIATLLILLFKRTAALLADAGASGVPLPMTQQHVADALGLSLVHTNKTLHKRERRGLHHIGDGRLFMRAQERIACLLGVRREGATGGAIKLQRVGPIHYHRGHISIIDRSGLEARSCGCYGVVRQAYDRLSRNLGAHRRSPMAHDLRAAVSRQPVPTA